MWRPGTRSPFGRALTGLACAVVLLSSSPAWASVAPNTVAADDPSGGGAQGGITLLPEQLRLNDAVGGTPLVPWSRGRRMFGFAWRSDEVVAFDADSLREVGRMPLIPGLVPSLLYSAVDPENGRLFVPFRTPSLTGLASAGTSAVTRSESCTHLKACIGGIWVLDGASMQPIRRISLAPFRVDGGSFAPRLRALTYAPPRSTGEHGKVLAVIEERVHSGDDGSNNPSVMFGSNVTYLVQFDPDDGTQDWVMRIDACRGTREPNTQFRPVAESRFNSATVFRTLDLDRPMIYVGCHGSGVTATIVRIALDPAGYPTSAQTPDPNAELGAIVAGEPPSAATVTSAAPQSAEVFLGPRNAYEMISDPIAERILLRVIDGSPEAEVWWVFDGKKSDYLGTIGIGRFNINSSISGFDPETGRLYVLGPSMDATSDRPAFEGGLFVADTRRTPVAQALRMQEFATLLPKTARKLDGSQSALAGNSFPMHVDPAADGRPTRIFMRPSFSQDEGSTFYRIFSDTLPISVDPPSIGYAGRTLDLDEVEGVTQSVFDGAARGYGVRALFVGGLDTATRLAQADPTYATRGGPGVAWPFVRLAAPGLAEPQLNPCGSPERDVSFGFIGSNGPVVVDGNGGRGTARPIVYDAGTGSDLEKPLSRCATMDWNQVWTSALFGHPPADEPTLEGAVDDGTAECVGGSDSPVGTWGDPIGGLAAARVECGSEDVQGYSYARGMNLPGAQVAEALSSFRIYRDTGRGIVSRVESVARGIRVDGVLSINTVRGIAESWANGRQQPSGDRDAGYQANCDFERTAGTCFQRHLFGVWTPGYSCGPCGDEARAVDAMSRTLGANSRVRLRQPDARLAEGAENGFLAAVQKPDSERFSDMVLNNDLLLTVVPVLEIIRYANPNHSTGERGTKGRQIYQFAGVEVSSSYGIGCLLVYDEATNTCAASKEEPGSITVNLTDSDGKALAGGAFEVRQDIDTDGVVGLKDALIPDGACVTTDDGVGTCTFDALQPGSYLVSQVAAPPGYGKVADPFVVELASGEARTVAFQNTSNVSTIAVSAADEAGKPVLGAQFAVYPDADSDGKVAADAQPAATCTTDASGSCSMQVPAGSYVLVQSSAPGGLEPIEPVAFTFASGGQTAAVGVVNYPAGGLPQPEPAAAPVYSDPPAQVVTETVADYTPSEPTVADVPQVSIPDAVGGTIVRVIQAPGDALRLLSRDPKQAGAWTASLLLFALALMAVRRRQQAIELIQE